MFLINLIYFRPWSLNLFYEKVFAEVDLRRAGVTFIARVWSSSSASPVITESSATSHRPIRSKVAARWRKDLEQLRAYPLSRQTESQRLSTRVLDWFLARQVEGERFQFHNYPVNQLSGVQNEFPTFMANTHRLLAPRDCDYYLQRLDALPAKFDQTLDRSEAARSERHHSAALRG